MNPRLATTYWIGWLAWVALSVLQLLWHGWLFPARIAPPWLVLTLVLVPLLLPLLAIRRPQRALLWIGIVSLFYFCHGIAEAWSTPMERGLALLEIGLTVLLIISLGASVRRKPVATVARTAMARSVPDSNRR